MLNRERYWRITSSLGVGLLILTILLFGLESSQSADKIIVFGILMIISKLQIVKVNGSFLSTDFGFVFAGITILGPIITALIKAVTTMATQLYLHREDKSFQKYLKSMFNVGQYVLSYFFGLAVYGIFDTGLQGNGIWRLIPTAAGVSGYFMANNFFVEYSLFLQCNRNNDNWKRAVLADAHTYLVSVPSGVMATYIYRHYGFCWSVAVFAIYLMMGYIYTLYMNLKEKNRELSSLLNTATIMASTLDYEDVLERVMESLESIVVWDTICIYVYQQNKLVPAIYEGFKDNCFKDIRIKPGAPLGGSRLFSQEAVIINNCDKDPEFKNYKGFPKETKTIIAIPLFINNELIGGISITSNLPGTYSRRHLHLMSILPNQAAVAMSNAKLFSSTSEMAVTDGLTKLYNHRYIFDELHRRVGNDFTGSGKFSLILLDIDRFKSYNDMYGHLIGDTILVNLSEVLRKSVRDVDTVGRYGGEEFCIILPGISSDKAAVIAERIRQTVETTELAQSSTGDEIFVTISAGVASYPEDAKEANDLVEKADEALMFGAKLEGRNKVVVFSQYAH